METDKIDSGTIVARPASVQVEVLLLKEALVAWTISGGKDDLDFQSCGTLILHLGPAPRVL
jgi:hypothetical protein